MVAERFVYLRKFIVI